MLAQITIWTYSTYIVAYLYLEGTGLLGHIVHILFTFRRRERGEDRGNKYIYIHLYFIINFLRIKDVHVREEEGAEADHEDGTCEWSACRAHRETEVILTDKTVKDFLEVYITYLHLGGEEQDFLDI